MFKKNQRIIIATFFMLFFVVTGSFVWADDGEDNNNQPIQITPPATLPITTPVAIPANNSFIVPEENIQGSLIDSDGDGIIDILDLYPGEDDFAFAVSDTNKNGIADDLEYLLTK